MRKKVAEAIDGAQREWSDEFDSVIQKLSQEHYLPSSVFVTADEDMRLLVKKLISERYTQRLNFEEAPDIVLLDEAFMGKICTFEKACRNDAFLALEALFARRVLLEK